MLLAFGIHWILTKMFSRINHNNVTWKKATFQIPNIREVIFRAETFAKNALSKHFLNVLTQICWMQNEIENTHHKNRPLNKLDDTFKSTFLAIVKQLTLAQKLASSKLKSEIVWFLDFLPKYNNIFFCCSFPRPSNGSSDWRFQRQFIDFKSTKVILIVDGAWGMGHHAETFEHFSKFCKVLCVWKVE